jgi:hypothetical protein
MTVVVVAKVLLLTVVLFEVDVFLLTVVVDVVTDVLVVVTVVVDEKDL